MTAIDRNTFLREWVKDLRSGAYRQAKEKLCVMQKSGPSYCCLGVACLTALRMGMTVENEWEGRGTLPPNLADLVGDKDPNLRDKDGDSECASELNDNLGYSFLEIADAIERMWPEAFAPPISDCGIQRGEGL